MIGLAARLRAIPSWQLALGLALLALGFLVTAQLASEGPRVRYTTQERTPLVETVLDLQGANKDLEAQILDLRRQIQDLERQGQGSAAIVRELSDSLERVRIAAGLIPLQGSGVVLQLEDSTQPLPPGGTPADLRVTAADIRAVVEELWLAGAEAIAINGERLTATTAIIDIGPSILVNAAYQAPPYQIAAIGPGDLYDRLTARQGFVDFVTTRAEGAGIQLSAGVPESVDIPAYAGFINLRFARVVLPPASPGPSPTAEAPE